MTANVECGCAREKRSFRILERALDCRGDARMGLDEKYLRLRRTHRHAPDCRCQRSHREALAVGEQQIALFDTQIPRDGANHDRMMRTVQVERDLRIEPAHEI